MLLRVKWDCRRGEDVVVLSIFVRVSDDANAKMPVLALVSALALAKSPSLALNNPHRMGRYFDCDLGVFSVCYFRRR